MPEILMDTGQVHRIFDNLLKNSVKYVKASPVRIDIQIRKQKNCGQKKHRVGKDSGICTDSIVLEWKDNGQGGTVEKLPQIFEHFYRCDESRNEKSSGVGLYVVKYIIECHDGAVRAERDMERILTRKMMRRSPFWKRMIRRAAAIR